MPTSPEDSSVSAVCDRLRAEGVDVVRVSYPDLIGVDRGRDVLLEVLPAVLEHGLAFCRAVYHTSPMGDVVPVPGGLDAGLPDIEVFPDLSSLTALPWEPHAAWCIGEARTPDGEPAPEAPRAVARRVAERISALGYELACGPELEFYLCQPDGDGRWRRYAADRSFRLKSAVQEIARQRGRLEPERPVGRVDQTGMTQVDLELAGRELVVGRRHPQPGVA